MLHIASMLTDTGVYMKSYYGFLPLANFASQASKSLNRTLGQQRWPPACKIKFVIMLKKNICMQQNYDIHLWSIVDINKSHIDK